MQTNLELTNLINECLKHPNNKEFKGNFEIFTSILFSREPENDDKIYTREDFSGLKIDSSIVNLLYCIMEETILECGGPKEFDRLCHCHDKIDFHWDNDVFFQNALMWNNKDIFNIMVAHGFEINEKCIEHYRSHDFKWWGSNTEFTEIIDTLILNYHLQNSLVDSPIISKPIKI